MCLPSIINILFLVICYIYSMVICESDAQPKYVDVFSKQNQWEGTYIYNGTSYYCMMFIHSEHYLKKDGLLVTFKDRQGATIEMEGEPSSSSDLDVTFTVHVMFDHVDRFPTNFSFAGSLSQVNGIWTYKAQVTVPDNDLFGEISLQPSDHTLGPALNDEDSKPWRYAVIIGIPIILAVIGVGGTVGLIYWAIKKGYIRHVPKTYDNMDNPAVKYETNAESVHI